MLRAPDPTARRGLALVVALAAAVAAPAPTARADAAAQSRFHDALARRYFAQGRYEEAIQEFFLAQRITPTARTMFNVAVCFLELGQDEEAFLAFSEYLASLPPEDADEGRRATAERSLARLGARVARVAVDSSPPGATIYVDRVDIGSYGRTPRLIAVPPGARTIRLEAPGHRPVEVPVTAVAGDEVEARGVLEPIVAALRVASRPAGAVRVRSTDGQLVAEGRTPFRAELPPDTYTLEVAAPGHVTLRDVVRLDEAHPTDREVALDPLPLPTGRLTVTANVPDAVVRLDGEPMGFAPLVLPEVEVGRHALRVEAEAMEPWQGDLDVEVDAPAWATVTLEPRDARRHSAATWALGGVGVAALVAAAGVGLAARAQHREAQEVREAVRTGTGTGDYDAMSERGTTLNTAADALLVAGGVALFAAIVTFVVEAAQGRRPSRGVVTVGAPEPR